MLSSIVIDYLQTFVRVENVGIAYIFCDYRTKLEQTPMNLIASLLKQLLQEKRYIPDNLKSLYQLHNRKQTRPTLDELARMLQSETSKYSQVFLVIDALDECPDDDGRRQVILSKIRVIQAVGNLNLMATSRFIPKIAQEFHQSIQLEILASDEDIHRYLEGQMFRMTRCVKRDIRLQETIKNSIVKAVGGMYVFQTRKYSPTNFLNRFLLAQLHFDSLTDRTSPKAIKVALENLPRGSYALDIAYDEAMKRINNQKTGFRNLAELVLSWITYAKRPLTMAELQCALAVEPNETKLDKDNLSDIEEIVSVCEGLVTVDEESNIIRLVHYTSQEYFERIRLERFPDAEQKIATVCLTYLSFDTFEGHCPSDKEFKARLQDNVFLDYAAKFRGHHMQGPREEAVKDLALKFLGNDLSVTCAVQALFVPDYQYQGYSQRTPGNMLGVHLCAYFGLTKTMASLFKLGNEPANSRDSYRRTPLWYAAAGGHEAVVRQLLRKEIDLDFKDQSSRTPLSMAAESGHEAVVRLLLAREEVNPDNIESEFDQTLLSRAVENGHEAVVRLLLANKRVNLNSSYGLTPLSRATRFGHEGVVRLLLANERVNPDSKDGYGQTPLSLAAENGQRGGSSAATRESG